MEENQVGEKIGSICYTKHYFFLPQGGELRIENNQNRQVYKPDQEVGTKLLEELETVLRTPTGLKRVAELHNKPNHNHNPESAN